MQKLPPPDDAPPPKRKRSQFGLRKHPRQTLTPAQVARKTAAYLEFMKPDAKK